MKKILLTIALLCMAIPAFAGLDVYQTVTINRVLVGTASTTIEAADSLRRNLLIVNDSSAVVYLSENVPAQVGYGIRLNANGGSYEWDVNNLSLKTIYAIASATGNYVCTKRGRALY